ncbi:NADP-dependent oxidoreductase [Lacticaseibacillus sp. GG6-2]
MIRFGFDHFGGPDVFTTIEQAPPQPKAGQVQLQVLGFGLNPYDASLRRGEQQETRPLKFPIVPGTDVVGRVTSLGQGVSGFAIGDIVMNYRPLGGYSEYVTASVTKLIAKPSALSFLDAAALPQIGVAAYSIIEQLALPAGARLVIIGAGGGVGSLLVQLAKCRGFTVTAIAAASHHEQLQALGADTILDYAQARQQAQPVADAVVNAINGGADHDLSRQWVRAGGIVLTTANVAMAPGNFDHQPLAKLAPTEAAFNFLATVSRTWGLTIRIAAVLDFSLAGVQRGHALLDAGHVDGKLVVMQPAAILNASHDDRNLL